MKLRRITTFLGFFLSFTGFSQGYASESLRFDAPVPRSSLEKIELHTSKTLDQGLGTFDIASADLNHDGLNEFILRSKNCVQKETCRFVLLGETGEGVLSLGDVNGYHMLLGNDSTHGVRNILLYDNAENDFSFKLLHWSPQHSEYREAGL